MVQIAFSGPTAEEAEPWRKVLCCPLCEETVPQEVWDLYEISIVTTNSHWKEPGIL